MCTVQDKTHLARQLLLKVVDVRKFHQEEEAIGELLVEQHVLFLCISHWSETGTEKDSDKLEFNVAHLHIEHPLEHF